MGLRVGDHVSDSKSEISGYVLASKGKFTTFYSSVFGRVRIRTRDLLKDDPSIPSTLSVRKIK